jgi:hypothetical protein
MTETEQQLIEAQNALTDEQYNRQLLIDNGFEGDELDASNLTIEHLKEVVNHLKIMLEDE